MTKYKWQTNPALLTHGELTDNGGQLTSNNGSGNVVVGNPSGATALATLAQTYAQDALDLSIAKTLGPGFIFLTGSSFDAMGVGVFEFEEQNGTVYGLYGRTDGLNQQVYYSGAWTNRQGMQYTTVPYVPPFLSGNIWQAACVCGSDLQGFTLALRDTTNATLTLRYIYVRHNGSLLNTSGHTYVEITPVVNALMSANTYVAGGVPRIVRVGAYFLIAYSDWQFGEVRFGGWNAQDSTYPFTNAALPGSSPTYTPTQFTITTLNLPGSDITTGATFPILLGGGGSPSGINLFKLYNMNTGAVSNPVYMNAPNPIVAGWTTNMASVLEAEVDSGGNVCLALGSMFAPGDINNNSNNLLFVMSAKLAFTAGSAGAYTNAQVQFVTPTSGGDTNHSQPYPYFMGYGANEIPNEAVASNPATPSTCVNKLPICGWFLGQNHRYGNTPTFHWYYSGVVSQSAFGNGNIIRGIIQPTGNGAGSLAAAQANKLAMIYPQFNVVRRLDFNITNGANMVASYIQPSGQLSQSYFGHMIGQDLIFTAGVSNTGAQIYTVSQYPSGSLISDASYNRFGAVVPGFKPRIGEYPVTGLTPINSQFLSNWGCCWPTGMAAVNQPVNFMFPAITDGANFPAGVNGVGLRLGNFTKSGNTYTPPPIVWNYASNIMTQAAAVKAAAVTATQGAQSGFAAGGVLGVELVPVLNSAGNGIAFAIGLVQGRDSTGGILQTSFFMTPCTITGSTVNLSNTSSITLLDYNTISTTYVTGVYGGQDQFSGFLYVVYPATAGGNWYLAWKNANSCGVTGDSVCIAEFIQFNSSNAKVSSNNTGSSNSRAMLSCSAQHQGLAIFPYRDGDTVPEADMPISRYTTSAVNSQNDFSASFLQAISNPRNLIPGDPQSRSYNIAELMTLQSINNVFLLQLGAISGRINHKEFVLPSTFLDMTSQAPGVYYLYVVDTGSGIAIQYDTVQRAESSTNMYFGTFTRTTTGFSNENSIQEVVRFGTSRLQIGNITAPIPGSCIRFGPYPMTAS